MPTFNTPMLTNAGRDLLGRVNAGKDTVSYTKTVFSSMDNSNKSDDDIKKITDVTPAEITTQPSTNYEDGNTIEVRGIGNNKGIHNAVAINTYATYAKDDDGDEFPFAIAVSQTPDYMPADSGQAITNLTFSIMFTMQDTKNVNFTDPHNEAPTYQDIVDMNKRVDGIQGTLNETLKPYDERISDNRNDIDSLKGNVYSKQDTDNSIKTAMNQANSNKTIDNHDGTINVNGNDVAIQSNLAPCDLNTVIRSGKYISNEQLTSYTNIPYDYDNVSNGYYFTLNVENNANVSICQKIYSEYSVIYRNGNKINGNFGWSNWHKLVTDDNLQNKVNELSQKIDDLKNEYEKNKIVSLPNGADLNDGYPHGNYWDPNGPFYYYDGKSNISNAPTSHRFLLKTNSPNGNVGQNIKDLDTGNISYRLTDSNKGWTYGINSWVNFPMVP